MPLRLFSFRYPALWLFFALVLLGKFLVCIAAQEEDNVQNNPYVSGCLYEKMPNWDKKRVCNSDDPLNASANGLCRIPDVPLEEVRVYGHNWETAYFEAWLLQIILGEMLDVPVTIEPGSVNPDIFISFYDTKARFEFDKMVSDSEEIAVNNALKYDMDCTQRDVETNEFCVHYFPECWTPEEGWVQNFLEEGVIDPPASMGVVAYEGLFVPQFTAKKEPTVLSYLGMQGDKNRQKLADLFLSPTNWKDYCEEVSDSSCAESDTAAQRAPTTPKEEESYYVEGLYTGHFRKTDQQDCDRFPHNCSGHLAPYPCGWTTYAEAQMYHLNIALKGGGPETNGGYPYGHLQQLLLAANATQSNLMIEFWIPHNMDELLRGTPSELMKVALPFPTQACLKGRHGAEDLCHADWKVRVGNPVSACDEAAQALTKITVKGLLTRDDGTPEATQSPAYNVLQQFLINEFQLSEIFQLLKTVPTPRDAVCQWAVENFDNFIKPLVPRSHPRTLREHTVSPLMYASLSLAIVSCLLVLITTWGVYKNKKNQVFVYAQIEFLWILLFGGMALGVGAALAGGPPTNGTCVGEIWMVNIGYTLMLVPLIVKVAAINRIMMASKRMMRVTIRMQSLLGATGLVSATIVVYCFIWTILDAPTKTFEYDLTDTSDQEGNTIVEVRYYCKSESMVWDYISVGWTTVLLLASSVLAFQTRNVRQDFNESQVLTALIYAHFGIVLLRVISFFLTSTMYASALAKFRSILYSLDVMVTIAIYFVPKFLAITSAGRSSMRFLGTANEESGFSTSGSLQPNSRPTTYAGISMPQHMQSSHTTNSGQNHGPTMPAHNSVGGSSAGLDNESAADEKALAGDPTRPTPLEEQAHAHVVVGESSVTETKQMYLSLLENLEELRNENVDMTKEIETLRRRLTARDE